MISLDWTLSGLSVELGLDRRAMARALEGLPPDQEKKVGKRTERTWKMAAVVAHMHNDGDRLDLSSERAKLAVLQQEKLQLEIAELRGSLVRVDEVQDEWVNTMASVRAKLLAMPAKLAIAVAPSDRIQIAQDRAQALVYEALSELSGNIEDDNEPTSGDGERAQSVEPTAGIDD